MRFNIVTDSNTATLAVFRPVTWNTEVKVYSWGEYGEPQQQDLAAGVVWR